MRGERMLVHGRKIAVQRMTETITAGTFAEGADELGNPTRVPAVVRYTGRARVRWASRGVALGNGPAMPIATQEPYVSLPIDAPRLEEGDEILITGSSADPLIVGRVMRVQGEAIAGQATAARYPCEETS